MMVVYIITVENWDSLHAFGSGKNCGTWVHPAPATNH